MILDKTLADYIKRAQEELKKDTSQPAKEEKYEVFPEDDGTDRPKNPYGEH